MGGGINYQNAVILKQGIDSSTTTAAQGILSTLINITYNEAKEMASEYRRIITYQECPLFQYTSNTSIAWRVASIYDFSILNDYYESVMEYPIFDINSWTWSITIKGGGWQLMPIDKYYNHRECKTGSEGYDRISAYRMGLYGSNPSVSYVHNYIHIDNDGNLAILIGYDTSYSPNTIPTRTYKIYGIK